MPHYGQEVEESGEFELMARRVRSVGPSRFNERERRFEFKVGWEPVPEMGCLAAEPRRLLAERFQEGFKAWLLRRASEGIRRGLQVELEREEPAVNRISHFRPAVLEGLRRRILAAESPFVRGR
ncbi:MAG: hypothetical protein V1787_05675 [Candidatus Micrarchaeota archaeon]